MTIEASIVQRLAAVLLSRSTSRLLVFVFDLRLLVKLLSNLWLSFKELLTKEDIAYEISLFSF